MAVTVPELLASRAITKTISTMDFNADHFAVFFSRGGTAIQHRFFNLFLAMCRYWADLYRNGAVDESDGAFYSLCVYAARILDITPYEV